MRSPSDAITQSVNLEAEKSVAALAAKRNDRWYPNFHIAAEGGWINDPNGLSYFGDRYQVYFQHNPYGTRWGNMHWGHVSSADMVTWRREPIALAPSILEDRDGIFSGSAVEASGELFAYYTGHRWNNGVDDAEGNLQVQCLATSTDGVTFEKEGVIIDCPEGVKHFRDPKVWRMEDKWYMVFGVCSVEDRGEIWLYASDNMRDWEFSEVVYQDPDPNVFMLECPDMFPLGGKWVITYCPMGKVPTGYEARNGHNAGYVVGTWQPGQKFQTTTSFTIGDWGHQYYAPQSFLDPQDRRITYGWMGSFTTSIPSQPADRWSGQLTIPRVLTLNEENLLCANPLPELTNLRLETNDFGQFNLEANQDLLLLDDIDGAEVELEIDLSTSTAERISLNIHKADNGPCTVVSYDELTGRVVLDRQGASHGDRGYRSAPVTGERLKLRLFIDRGSVEVFIGDGSATLSSFSFPAAGPRRLELCAEMGDASVKKLLVHQLGSIWED